MKNQKKHKILKTIEKSKILFKNEEGNEDFCNSVDLLGFVIKTPPSLANSEFDYMFLEDEGEDYFIDSNDPEELSMHVDERLKLSGTILVLESGHQIIRVENFIVDWGFGEPLSEDFDGIDISNWYEDAI